MGQPNPWTTLCLVGAVDAAGGVGGGQLGSQQLDEVHLSAGERVADARARDVALRPGARVHGAVVARVDVVVQPVDVVLVEYQRAPPPPPPMPLPLPLLPRPDLLRRRPALARRRRRADAVRRRDVGRRRGWSRRRPAATL